MPRWDKVRLRRTGRCVVQRESLRRTGQNSIVLGFEEDSGFRPRGSLPECKRVWIHLTFSSSLSPVG